MMILTALLLVIFIVGVIVFVQGYFFSRSNSGIAIGNYLRNPDANAELVTDAFVQCPDAPFILPTEGFIGLLWRDDAGPYTPLRRHTGLDIFGGQPQGIVPVYAVYDGWITRLDDWFSTVIIRHDDPLQPGRTIWTYYTHLASRDGNESYIADDYPQGTFGTPISQGTLIGYQGAYSPQFPVAVHVHISIVRSEGNGSFRNEAILENTLNPSPYFGMDLNADTNIERPVRCIKAR